MKYVSKNPYTGEVKNEYPFATHKQIEEAIETGHRGFSQWKTLSYKQRGTYFMKLAEVMRAQKTELAAMLTFEMGKPLKESLAELDKSILCCEYYANNAENLLQAKTITGTGLQAEIIFQPLGVIFGIFPWNFPFWQVLRFVVPTLMAGNTAIFKHAANVPNCAIFIEKLFVDAGFPTGALQNILADVADVEFIIANPKIKAVTLTGSEKAGASVASIAGKYLKKSVMELGGSDAFVVLEDADLEKTIPAALRSRFQNSGQSCISAKRFIVRKEIVDAFTHLMVEGVKKLKQGDPTQEGINMGTLARPDLADRVEEQLQLSLSAGAKLLIGGKRVGDAVVEPTIISHVPLTSPAFTQEVFGPVAPIFVADTDEEALQLANYTLYGLGSSVWTKNADRARYFAEGINSGMVYINEMVRSTPELPFGGINNSGYGRELSVFGITEFVNIKGIYSGIK
jgi:succinate-semialdehyde dehydrogenase / glutarate-semialdehyde dehydrogenase